MLIEEFVEVGERVRHYSDTNMMIRQLPTNILYEDAVDVLPCRFTYEETDIPIEGNELSDSEALAIILGEGEE